jgi:hypothetical protein
MVLSQLLLISLALQLSTGDIDYRFNYNYDTQVYDWEGNGFHGVKTAIGTSSAINTSYGLYLNGDTVKLPPNSASSSTTLKDNPSFKMRVFVRLLQGVPGTTTREIITFKSSSNTRLQLRQQSASETSSPTFEVVFMIGVQTYTEVVSGSYALSKANADKWYYFKLSLEDMGSSTLISVCVNNTGSISVSKDGHASYDWTDNYLGGFNTRGIYYRFIYTPASTGACTSSNEYFSPTALGNACSYVCPSSTLRLCDVDSYTYDTDCNDCSTSCGNYGCLENSPLTCATSSCPAWPLTNSACKTCNLGTPMCSTEPVDSQCSCGDSLYTTSSSIYSACSGIAVTTIAAANRCASCYANSSLSSESPGNCVCNAGTAEIRSTTSLECFSKE